MNSGRKEQCVQQVYNTQIWDQLRFILRVTVTKIRWRVVVLALFLTFLTCLNPLPNINEPCDMFENDAYFSSKIPVLHSRAAISYPQTHKLQLFISWDLYISGQIGKIPVL